MILQEMHQVPIAEADWTDDGTVELLTFPTTGEHRTHMAPETARALARQLETAATEAEKAAGETGVQRAHRAVQHAFDVDPDVITPDQARANAGVLSHDWRWVDSTFSVVPVCSRCGRRAVNETERASACPGSIEAPEVRS